MATQKTNKNKKVTPKKAVKKATKKVTPKKAVKKATKKVTKKAAVKKATKKVTKKAAVKKVTAKKSSTNKSTAKKKVAKKATVKKAAVKKTPVKKTVTKKAAKTPTKKSIKKKPVAKKAAKKAVKKSAISKSVQLNSDQPEKSNNSRNAPIVFSLEDVEALVANRKEDINETKPKTKVAKKKATKKATKAVKVKPAKVQKHAAASIADILGFNPNQKKSSDNISEKDIPAKWKKYYKLLLELRAHVKEELALHTSETLKQSSKDNSGDLSGYGSHQADAGTETFDRDFALGILSNEQDALNEIEEAIYRIKNGTYGVCEETGKPINKQRLTVVPFTRFSLEGQVAFEKNNRKRRNKVVTGLFEDNAGSLNLGLDSDDE